MDKLRAEANAVLAQPEVAERLIAAGSGDPTSRRPIIAALIRDDYENYGKLIREIGVKVD